MKYRYFVCYKFPQGYGRCELQMDAPVTCIEDIVEMELKIVDLNPEVSRVSILFWREFPGREE